MWESRRRLLEAVAAVSRRLEGDRPWTWCGLTSVLSIGGMVEPCELKVVNYVDRSQQSKGEDGGATRH